MDNDDYETQEEHCYSDVLDDMRTNGARSYHCTDRMCGAQDCGTCFPAGQKWFACRFCGAQRQGWELSNENEIGEDTCICEECLLNYDPESRELIDD